MLLVALIEGRFTSKTFAYLPYRLVQVCIKPYQEGVRTSLVLDTGHQKLDVSAGSKWTIMRKAVLCFWNGKSLVH